MGIIVPSTSASLRLRVFGPYDEQRDQDNELEVAQVDIEDGTIWVYLKETP